MVCPDSGVSGSPKRTWLRVRVARCSSRLAEKVPCTSPARVRWREFADRGELLMIGPFANALEDGVMGIFTTREAAEEFVRSDPFVLRGVVRHWTVPGMERSPRPGQTSPVSKH